MSRKTYHHALPIGTRIENYEITDVLGAGGFGITYKGHDHDLNTEVAIKEYLPTSLAVRRPDGATVIAKSDVDTENYDYGLKRFMEEAQTLALFKEPNIVRVTRFFRANGTAYLVMEYEDGQSLSAYLRKRKNPLSEEQIKAIIVPILDGLRVVHEKQYLHRDIKPGNIYLRKNGSPVLLDFGAARQALVGHSQSLTGVVTPGYGPFEQYNTRGKQGPWTDLYAIGATMYRCITNKTPPDAPDRIAALQEKEPDPIVPAVEAGSGQYSREFLEVIDWMLSPNPSKRPQTVHEALGKLVPGWSLGEAQTLISDSTAEPTQISGQATKKIRFSFPFARVGIALVLLVAVILGVKYYWPALQSDSDSGSTTTVAVKDKTPLKTKTTRPAPSANPINKVKRLFDKGENSAAVALLRKLAERGNAEAQTLLGNAYYRGRGIARSYEEAVYWYRKAASQGYAQAQTNLGIMYKLGRGVDKNVATAVGWFRKAAQKNHAQAQNHLANHYYTGDGVSQNKKQAIQWYRKAAKNGNSMAQTSLGNIYYQGKDLPKSYSAAVSWYTRAAKRNYADAQANLAYMFEKGYGVSRNTEKAIYWYRQAVANGHKSAGKALRRLNAS